MEIQKITENGFNLHKEENHYVLAMGAITRQTNRETTIKVTGINAAEATATGSCSCVEKKKLIIDADTLQVTLKYKECETRFSKIIHIADKKNKIEIKLQGTCNT